MTKTELEQALAAELAVNRADARDLLNAILDALTLALSRQQRIALPGFGTFAVKSKPQRQGRNPATGEAMTIAASHGVVFKPGTRLRAAVSASSESAKEVDA